MTLQCNCINSRLFPHRASKCLLVSGRPDVPLTPTMMAHDINARNTSHFQTEALDIYSEESDIKSDSDAVPAEPEDAETILEANASIANGNEQCDCVAYRLQPHRKSKCCWKNHVLLGMAAAVAVAGSVSAVCLLTGKQSASNSGNPSAEPSTGNSKDCIGQNGLKDARVRDLAVNPRNQQGPTRYQVTGCPYPFMNGIYDSSHTAGSATTFLHELGQRYLELHSDSNCWKLVWYPSCNPPIAYSVVYTSESSPTSTCSLVPESGWQSLHPDALKDTRANNSGWVIPSNEMHVIAL